MATETAPDALPPPAVAAPGTDAPPLREGFATVGGRRMRYLVVGSGRPLVLLHGFISSGEEFGGRFAMLAASRTIIAPDLPGNGDSEPLRDGRRHTAEALAVVVGELLDQLGVESFDAGGVCLGTTVACALAQQRPKSVGKLILHTPLLGPTVVKPAFRYQVRWLTRAPWWNVVRWLSCNRSVSDLYRRFVVRESFGGAELAGINFRNQLRADSDAAREWLVDGITVDNTAWLRQRAESSLVVTAGHDTIVDLQEVWRRLGNADSVRVVVDSSAAHGWSAAAVARHAEILKEFLAGVEDSGTQTC